MNCTSHVYVHESVQSCTIRIVQHEHTKQKKWQCHPGISLSTNPSAISQDLGGETAKSVKVAAAASWRKRGASVHAGGFFQAPGRKHFSLKIQIQHFPLNALCSIGILYVGCRERVLGGITRSSSASCMLSGESSANRFCVWFAIICQNQGTVTQNASRRMLAVNRTTSCTNDHNFPTTDTVHSTATSESVRTHLCDAVTIFLCT